MPGKICDRCGKKRRFLFFRQEQIKDSQGKTLRHVRVDVCKACEAEDSAKQLKKKVAERVEARRKKELRWEVPHYSKSVRKQASKLTVERAQEILKLPAETVYQKQMLRAARYRLKDIKDETYLSPEERELASRQLMKRKLLPFIRKFNKNYQAGWAHKDICRRLEQFVKDVEDQKGPRLMLFMPPRHGKSEIASINFPGWVLGKHPDWELIASSYAVSLPVGFSRKVQALIADPYYQILFPETKIHPKAQAADAWMTDKYEGGYIAAGVGTGISGKGAHILIIDDPVKDAEEADSATQREKVWDWWGSTAKTRLAPGGGVLIIQTRWHDDDLSGRLLTQQKNLEKEFRLLISEAEKDGRDDLVELYQTQMEQEIDRWEVIKYPATALHDEYLDLEDGQIHEEPTENTTFLRRKGEALHPERFPKHRLMNMKRSMQPRHWSALYQQNPVPDEGSYFTKDMIRYSNGSVPPLNELKIFTAWDLAVGEKQTNDYSVGVTGGLDWQGYIHILDMVRLRKDTHTVADAILANYRKFPTTQQIGIEKGQLELAIKPQLKLLMKKYKLYPSFDETLRPITDKQVRARPLQGRMQQGMVLLPTGPNWVELMVHELLRFPGGTHDDIVDAMAWLARMITGVKEPDKPGSKKHKSWRTRLNEIEAKQRRGHKGHMSA